MHCFLPCKFEQVMRAISAQLFTEFQHNQLVSFITTLLGDDEEGTCFVNYFNQSRRHVT